jgi:hypothetical protein
MTSYNKSQIDNLTTFFWKGCRHDLQSHKEHIENIISQEKKDVVLSAPRQYGKTWMLLYMGLKIALNSPQRILFVTVSNRDCNWNLDSCKYMCGGSHIDFHTWQNSLHFNNNASIRMVPLHTLQIMAQKRGGIGTFEYILIDDVNMHSRKEIDSLGMPKDSNIICAAYSPADIGPSATSNWRFSSYSNFAFPPRETPIYVNPDDANDFPSFGPSHFG